MELNIFTRDNCEFCDQLVIPEGLKVNIIDIMNGYKGFTPNTVPVLQYQGMNLEGPQIINPILQLMKDAQDGKYKNI